MFIGIFFFVFHPIINRQYKKTILWGFNINKPTFLRELRPQQYVCRVKGIIYNFRFEHGNKKYFDEKKIFKNYQNSYDFGDGKYYFALRNKKIYVGIYVRKNDELLTLHYSMNANILDCAEIGLKIFQPASKYLNDEKIKEILLNATAKHGLMTAKVFTLIMGGIAIFVFLMPIFMLSLMGKKPKNYDEFIAENIILEKTVVVSSKTTLSYNSSYGYIILTSSFLRVFSMGKEIIKIPITDIKKYIEKKKLILPYVKHKAKIIISLKELGDDFLNYT